MKPPVRVPAVPGGSQDRAAHPWRHQCFQFSEAIDHPCRNSPWEPWQVPAFEFVSHSANWIHPDRSSERPTGNPLEVPPLPSELILIKATIGLSPRSLVQDGLDIHTLVRELQRAVMDVPQDAVVVPAVPVV